MKSNGIKIDEGTLRAYLDNTLSRSGAKQVEQQLRDSAEAQATLARLRQEMAVTEKALTNLAPSGSMLSPAPQALNALQSRLARDSSKFNPKLTTERGFFMLSKSFIKRHQPAVAGLAILLTVAIALSFAPIRAFAGDLLRIFRVQEVKVVPVDANRLEDLEENEEFSSLLDQFSANKEVVVDGGDPQIVSTLSEAATLVDFRVAEVTDIPNTAGPLAEVSIHHKSVYQIRLDPGLMEAIFEAGGIEIDLPDSLNGQSIIATRPTMLMQEWRNGEDLGLGFAQLESPQIEYPDDLDLNALGVAGLQLLGKSKSEAEQLAATIDWANTLIMPMPSDAEVEVTEVSINGIKGMLFNNLSDSEKMHRPEAGLMWQKDGRTYLLSGPYEADQLVAIAQSVR